MKTSFQTIAIKNLVEQKDQQEDELSFSFESSRILPFPAADVYTLLADAANWSSLLPHCQAVDMLYDDGSNQEFIAMLEITLCQQLGNILVYTYLVYSLRTF